MSKEEKIDSIIISAVLTVIAALSFVESLKIVTHHSWSPWGSSFGGKVTTDHIGYYPVFICIFVILQLILLWAVRKKSFICIICSVLDLFATMGPLVWLLYRATIERKLAEEWDKMVSDYYHGYIEVEFKWPVFVIMVLGAAVFILYLILFNHRKERVHLDYLSTIGNYAKPEITE